MNKLLVLGACGLLGLRAMGASDDPSQHELLTARCVAALEVNTEDLAAQVKAGRADLRPILLERLKYGAAFIGDSYLRGERDEARAKGLLEAALAAQKNMPEPELIARQSSCAQVGAQLLANADFISRAVVSQLANKRLKKLLDG